MGRATENSRLINHVAGEFATCLCCGEFKIYDLRANSPQPGGCKFTATNLVANSPADEISACIYDRLAALAVAAAFGRNSPRCEAMQILQR